METRYTKRQKVLLVLIAAYILGSVLFGIFITYEATMVSYNLALIITGLLFIWIGFSYLVIMSVRIKKVEIKNEMLIVKKPLYKKHRCHKIELSKIKYLDIAKPKGVLIRYDNGHIEKISTRGFVDTKGSLNLPQIIDLIINKCARDETIKRRIWTKGLTICVGFGIILIIGYIYLLVR